MWDGTNSVDIKQQTNEIFKKIAAEVENTKSWQRRHGWRQSFEDVVTEFHALQAGKATATTVDDLTKNFHLLDWAVFYVPANTV